MRRLFEPNGRVLGGFSNGLGTRWRQWEERHSIERKVGTYLHQMFVGFRIVELDGLDPSWKERVRVEDRRGQERRVGEGARMEERGHEDGRGESERMGGKRVLGWEGRGCKDGGERA